MIKIETMSATSPRTFRGNLAALVDTLDSLRRIMNTMVNIGIQAAAAKAQATESIEEQNSTLNSLGEMFKMRQAIFFTADHWRILLDHLPSAWGFISMDIMNFNPLEVNEQMNTAFAHLRRLDPNTTFQLVDITAALEHRKVELKISYSEALHRFHTARSA